MCPMCEKRARLLLQQQAMVESIPASSKGSGNGNAGGKPSLFRNPFKACKNLTHRCCSPLCESNRTSMASGRRSSAIAPIPSTPEHSGELTYLVSESPLSGESKDLVSKELPGPELSEPAGFQSRRKRKGLLRRLKKLTHGADHAKVRDHEPDSNESSFAACGRKVMAVADELEHNAKVRDGIMPSVATFLAAETDMEDSMSEASIAVTETNVSESTMVSMMGFNGSFYCSPFNNEFTSYHGSTLKSSAYDDDASSFAVIPRTSMNSSYVGRDDASDASGLSDRFGELDIGYLSLEESGEGPEFDDTVSISSDQSEHLDLKMHQLAQEDVVSESDLDLSTVDSQEWVTETDDAASILQRSRTHHIRDRDRHIDNNNRHHHQADDQQRIPLPLAPLQASDQENQQPQVTIPTTTSFNDNKNRALFAKKDTTPPEGRRSKSSDSAKRTTNPKLPDSAKRSSNQKSSESAKDASNQRGHDAAKDSTNPKFSDFAKDATETQPPDSTTLATTRSGICTEYLCSRCGRKELGSPEQCFSTYMGGEDQAVMAAKVVVLLGKYGNRKGLRVSGFTKESKDGGSMRGGPTQFSAKELERLRSVITPKTDAVSAFQNEVARMMLEGVDVPDLNMDVEQFIAGYMKLNSPFYVDLIEDFFKSVCMDCFGHMERVVHRGVSARAAPQRLAYAVMKPRKTKTIAGKANPSTTGKLPQ